MSIWWKLSESSILFLLLYLLQWISLSDGILDNFFYIYKLYRWHEQSISQQNCPNGLVYNPKKLWCDWPFNVPECNFPSTTTSGETSTSSPIPTTSPYSILPSTTTEQSSTTDSGSSTSGAPTTSTEVHTTSTVVTSTRTPTTGYGCPSVDGNYRDPKSCFSYYTCSNGYPYLMVF